MKVELISLELTNYRNIGHALLEFKGNSKIVGDNRVGKTNTLEAICWLLTDKLLNGGTDIASIKPLSDTKAEVRVEGIFMVNNRPLTIRKEYGEEWVKTRGSDELTFKGHYLKYYYNEVPQKTKRDFYALLGEDLGIDNFDAFRGIEPLRLLVDPSYIGELGEGDGWKYLREFIISLIGDVDDTDVFLKNPATAIIRSDLETRNGRIDELKKYYNGVIKSTKEQIIGIDSNIKMLEETNMPSIDEVNVSKKAIEEIDSVIAKLQSEKAADSIVVEIDKEVNAKTREMNDLLLKERENSREKELNARVDQLNVDYRNILVKKAGITEKISKLKLSIQHSMDIIKDKEKYRSELIEHIKKIDAEIKNHEHFNGVCPTCGRPFEGDEYESALQKYLDDLNNQRDGVLNLGIGNKKAMTDIQDKMNDETIELASLQSELDETEQNAKDISSELEKTTKELISVRLEVPTLPTRYYELDDQIKELLTKRDQVIADTKAANVHVNEKIQEQIAKKESFQKVLDDYNYGVRQQERLETIKLEKENTTAALAKYEQRNAVIELFIKTKLKMLDDRVSSVFGNIKFQLIKENINGGYDPVCKPYIYDIEKDKSTKTSWKSGSKSERVVTGIAIAECIKAKLGYCDLPFLFDEGGEISTDTFNTRFKTNAQLICVKVQDNINTPMVMEI